MSLVGAVGQIASTAAGVLGAFKGGALKIYDPNEVSIVICGIPISSGYAEDTFIEVHQMSPDYVTVVGIDGVATRTRTGDHRARILIKLMQSADANAALSTLSDMDRTSFNGAGVGPCTIRDSAGTTVFACAHGWVSQPPDAEFGRTATSRTWIVECTDLKRLDGGN